MKKIMLGLVMILMFMVVGCSNEEAKNEVTTEITTTAANVEATTEMVIEDKIVVSDWEIDKYSLDNDFGFDTYFMTVNFNNDKDYLLAYSTGTGYGTAVAEDGESRINRKNRNGAPDAQYDVVGRCEIQPNNTNDVSIKSFESEKDDSGSSIDYELDIVLETKREDVFLVAYKIYSEVTEYYDTGTVVMNDGEAKIYHSVRRDASLNEKFDIKIIGCIKFDEFESNKIFFDETEYSVDYIERGQLDKHQVYRTYTGTTSFEADDNTMIGILRIKTNCDSELGKSSIYEHRPIVAGKGVFGTYLEIPGDQSNDPVYQFVPDGYIPMEYCN